MNVADYLPYNKQNASVRVKFQSNVIFTLFWYRFTLKQVTISKFHLSKVSYLFPCGFESVINVMLSSTMQLIPTYIGNATAMRYHLPYFIQSSLNNYVCIYSNAYAFIDRLSCFLD